MNEEMHKLILSMGFVQQSAGQHESAPEYHHLQHALTFRPVPGLTPAGLADALITGGMAIQKLETVELIREAAKKLGFKF